MYGRSAGRLSRALPQRHHLGAWRSCESRKHQIGRPFTCGETRRARLAGGRKPLRACTSANRGGPQKLQTARRGVSDRGGENNSSHSTPFGRMSTCGMPPNQRKAGGGPWNPLRETTRTVRGRFASGPDIKAMSISPVGLHSSGTPESSLRQMMQHPLIGPSTRRKKL